MARSCSTLGTDAGGIPLPSPGAAAVVGPSSWLRSNACRGARSLPPRGFPLPAPISITTWATTPGPTSGRCASAAICCTTAPSTYVNGGSPTAIVRPSVTCSLAPTRFDTELVRCATGSLAAVITTIIPDTYTNAKMAHESRAISNENLPLPCSNCRQVSS